MNIGKRIRQQPELPPQTASTGPVLPPSAIGAALMSQGFSANRSPSAKRPPTANDLPDLEDAVRLIRTLIDENQRLRDDNQKLRDENLRFHIAHALMSAPARPRGRPRSENVASAIESERLLQSLEKNFADEAQSFRRHRDLPEGAPISERALLAFLISDIVENPTKAKAALKTLQNKLAKARATRKASQ